MAQKAEGVTIAFLGTGAMDVDTATDLIEEFIDATISSDDDPVRFIFPLTTNEFSDTLGELVEMAKQSDITYEVITHTGDKGRRSFTDITGSASKTYNVADVFTQMEQILTEAPTAILEVLWDKERDDELTEIVGRFVDAGIDVKDLTDGNAPIAANDEEEVEEATVEAEEATGEEEAEEATEEAQVVYARSDLEKLSRADVAEIVDKLGLPRRKATAAMVEEIMEAQGGFEEEPPGEETEEPGEEMTVEVIAGEIELTTGTLTQAIERFPSALHGVLDDFLINLAKTIEGLIFNATPEDPMPMEQPPNPRRLRAH